MKFCLRKMVVMLGLTVCFLTGCGIRVEEEVANVSSGEEYVYVAETEDFIRQGYISGICSSDDKLYLSVYNAEENDTRAYMVDLLTRQSMPIFLPLEERGTTEINQMTMDTEGNLIFIEKNTPDTGELRFLLKGYSFETKELISNMDITSVLEQGESTFVSGIVMDEDGDSYLAVGKSILVINKKGKLLSELHPNIKWFAGLEIIADGTPVFLAVSQAEDGLILGVMDDKTGKVEKSYEGIPGSNVGACVATGGNSDLYIDYDGVVRRFDLQTGEQTEVFRWSESNMSSEGVRKLVPLSNGDFAAVLMESKATDYHVQLAYLVKTPRSEADMRTTLVLGTLENNTMLQEAVNYFNKTNSEYRVEVKSYANSSASREEREQAALQMRLELISGNGPDIIDPCGFELSQLEAQGMVEDLMPYLKDDAELKDIEYFQSVLNANTVNDKLLCLPPYFLITTVVGRQADFGLESGMTTDEFLDIIGKNASERRVFQRNQASLMKFMLMQNFSRFIDWDTGVCNFDSEEFIRLLELVKIYGMTQEDEDRWIQEMEDGALYEMAMLEVMGIHNGLDYKSKGINFGEPVVCVGFPLSEGDDSNGTLIDNVNGFLMSASSKEKKGVWEFLRALLMPEYYEEFMTTELSNMNFPIRKDIYEQAFEKWMETESIVDENGEEQIVSTYTFGDYNGFEYRDILTEEDKAVITEVIENASAGSISYTELFVIVEEEAEAFYRGQKSADEVAAIIQSRAQVYVDENR